MFTKIKNTIKKFDTSYKRFLKTDIQKKKYKKIVKMVVAIIKFILFKKPYVLIVETGTICNLKCPTCPTPREIIVDQRTAKNMDFDRFKTIIDNSYKSFSAVLLYWSNEPLLNKDLANMVQYCNELNLYTFISTNVTLLTGQKFQEFADAGLDELLVCFDGFSAKTYERFRKGAKFETVKRNIENMCSLKKKLKTVNPWIEIQYVETKENSNEIAACKKWADETGVDGFRVQALCVVKYLPDFEKLCDEFYIEEVWEERYKRYSREGEKSCKNPALQVCVLVNGELTICCHDIKGVCSYGNLLEDSFENISKTKKYLAIKKGGKKRALSICKECY